MDKNGGNVARVRSHRILPPLLVEIRQSGLAEVLRLLALDEGGDVEGAALEHAELDQVQVDGVRERCEVDQVPHLGRVHQRRLRRIVVELQPVQEEHDRRRCIETNQM